MGVVLHIRLWFWRAIVGMAPDQVKPNPGKLTKDFS